LKTKWDWDAECTKCSADLYDADDDDNSYYYIDETPESAEKGILKSRREAEARRRIDRKFPVALLLADMDEPFLDPELKKLVVEWNRLSKSDHSLMEYKRKVEENKGPGFPLYEAPKEDAEPSPECKILLRKKIEAML
jgi:hypothetical protein